MNKTGLLSVAAGIASLVMSAQSLATTVTLTTNMGDIVINLYDETTPKTVENFLYYVNAGKYDGSVVHRSVDDFVMQAGSYEWSIQGDQEAERINAIATRQIDENDDDDTDVFVVDNEPLWSNVKGTIAMAKTSNEHSATSSWFINVGDDNTDNLDLQSSGFTVFGEVISGMDIVENINALTTYNFGGALTNMPLRSYDSSTEIAQDDLVYISQVTVTDASPDTAKDLDPTPNTLIYQQNVDAINTVKTKITEFVDAAEGYLTRAETAYTEAVDISEEKADIASAAVLKIEQSLIELDNQLDLAEQYVIDRETAETNNESVLKIIEIRDSALDAYSAAYDELNLAYQAVKSAEAAAAKEGSSGGSFSWLLMAVLGFTFARRAKKAIV
ncbi:peptidylprolyl isomerase [Catenovulum maritimum]|uniref:peptidylprolyl isomerase n=1 Tax=Catenovulum maritimum TaxID=1513271 RepID=UPI0006614BBA|nr:peptidylprolyl isomerase [Catenovulum maritimum]